MGGGWCDSDAFGKALIGDSRVLAEDLEEVRRSRVTLNAITR